MCYFKHVNLTPVYLMLNESSTVSHSSITVDEVFNADPFHPHTFFSFESIHAPYMPLVFDNLPRADLVMMNSETEICTAALEIKLTALPDNSTYNGTDEDYGCELVVRPDTIAYLALSIAHAFRHDKHLLRHALAALPVIDDWTDIGDVAYHIPHIADVLDSLLVNHLDLQKPMILQPVWKTIGKRLLLHEDAFDIFVWSDFAFTRLFFRDRDNIQGRLSRGARTIAWLAKMLQDFTERGKIHHQDVIDGMSFNTKNDKAFAVNGRVTQPYMASPQLTQPRVKRSALKDIILGGGENFLSPERRLDAAILSTPDLFD